MADPDGVTTRETDYAALVRNAEGESLNQKDDVYEFSNGRTFKDSGSDGGIYNPS